MRQVFRPDPTNLVDDIGSVPRLSKICLRYQIITMLKVLYPRTDAGPRRSVTNVGELTISNKSATDKVIAGRSPLRLTTFFATYAP